MKIREKITDLDKLTALLSEFEIRCSQSKSDGYTHVRLTNDYEVDGKVDGYVGFYTQFEFTEAGEFITVGAFE